METILYTQIPLLPCLARLNTPSSCLPPPPKLIGTNFLHDSTIKFHPCPLDLVQSQPTPPMTHLSPASSSLHITIPKPNPTPSNPQPQSLFLFPIITDSSNPLPNLPPNEIPLSASIIPPTFSTFPLMSIAHFSPQPPLDHSSTNPCHHLILLIKQTHN